MFKEPLPTAFARIDFQTTATIQVENRKARLANGTTPARPNVWYYRKGSGAVSTAVLQNYLGPVVNVNRGQPLTIKWVNTIPAMPGMPQMQDVPAINAPPMHSVTDLSGMNMSMGIVTHLHGARVSPASDGWPLLPAGYVGNGPTYQFPSTRTYTYDNDQRAAMLWYHDHSMDNTSVQVMAGLAGLYFVRDAFDDKLSTLVGTKQNEIPLVIQDRVVDCAYQGFNYWGGLPSSPSTPPGMMSLDRPEFLGDTIFVNGRPWPFVNVERQVYRLRILNGSNARTYALALIDPAGWSENPPSNRVWYTSLMTVIGNDAGFVSVPYQLNDLECLLIAPGQRLDVLLDLTGLPLKAEQCLRLVNMAIAGAVAGVGDEPIFQTAEPYSKSGGTTIFNSLIAAPGSIDNRKVLSQLNLTQANILQFHLGSNPASVGPKLSDVASIMEAAATDDQFVWNGSKQILEPLAAYQPPETNRFVLLMNNTTNGNGTPPHPLGGSGWHDTQMWELDNADPKAPLWEVPFDVKVNQPGSQAGVPGIQKYAVRRCTFFKQDPFVPIQTAKVYDALHPPTFTPSPGTYERWYIANIGNGQPLKGVSLATNDSNGLAETIPDMHPFHMHLVNFVVTNRWRLNADNDTFEPTFTRRQQDLDGTARHDTVMIHANELLELLVFFPPGYKGQYPYHCHLVEHEDMGMMLHFDVV